MRELKDASFRRVESPYLNKPKTQRGRASHSRCNDKKHLWTRWKITSMRTQIMGSSTVFQSMLTIQFAWQMDGSLLQDGIKKLKRELARLIPSYGGNVYIGVLEGRICKDTNRVLAVKPPHYHIIFDCFLPDEEINRLRRLTIKWGFDSIDYQFDTSEGADLRFCKYVCKDDNHTGHWADCKPTMLPSHWQNFQIPTCFKSRNFLKHQTTKYVYHKTKDLLKKSPAQPFYCIQYLGVDKPKNSEDEPTENLPSANQHNRNCYYLEHLQLRVFAILICIGILFPDRFLAPFTHFLHSESQKEPKNMIIPLKNSNLLSPHLIHKSGQIG